jgi:hypothetical protein
MDGRTPDRWTDGQRSSIVVNIHQHPSTSTAIDININVNIHQRRSNVANAFASYRVTNDFHQ